MDYDWLYNEYIVKDRRSKEIAEEYGCKQNTIQQWLLKHGISKEIKHHVRDVRHDYEQFDFLYHEHIILGKTIATIAEENNVSYDTIMYHMQRNGIKVNKQNRHKKYSEEEIESIVRLYVEEKRSAFDIANQFGTSHKTIISILHRRRIETRSMMEAQLNANEKAVPDGFMDADFLYHMHWDEGKSCKEIGEIFGVEAGTVRRQMHRLGIDTKSNSESKIGLMTGDKHPNWHGGISSLTALLREFFNTNQAPKIAERDHYTCQLCGAQHTVLHVHHIKEFSKIVREICDEHPDLSPDNADDRMKLYEIITHDHRFLDPDNLITYCKNCHLFKIHNYTRKTISSQASSEEGSETIL